MYAIIPAPISTSSSLAGGPLLAMILHKDRLEIARYHRRGDRIFLAYSTYRAVRRAELHSPYEDRALQPEAPGSTPEFWTVSERRISPSRVR